KRPPRSRQTRAGQMTVVSAVCGTFWGCLYAYQTFAAGALALLAGIVTAFGVWIAARLQVRVQERHHSELQARRRLYGCLALSSELKTLQRRAGQAAGTIRVHISSNRPVAEDTKEAICLDPPPTIAVWEAMSLLPIDVMRRCQELGQRTSDHNYDISRTRGTFGAGNFRKALLRRLDEIMAEAKALADEVGALADAEDG
ncbi:MAG: hypothetical protein MJA83_11480, partial [Gammaproteobacteria bacterium]|nr:hypothetical protein [Gammaproteobacteria bacterium]